MYTVSGSWIAENSVVYYREFNQENSLSQLVWLVTRGPYLYVQDSPLSISVLEILLFWRC